MPENQHEPYVDSKFREYMETKDTVRFIYRKVNEQHSSRYKYAKWTNELQDAGVEPKTLFQNVQKTCKSVKYNSFQYRLLHRTVITNVHLQKWGILDTDKCSFCGMERELYQHLFYGCNKVKAIWESVERLCRQLDPRHCKNNRFDYSNVILNTVNPSRSSVSNTIVLVAKQYIYAQRCLKNPLDKFELKGRILKCRNIEKYQAVKNDDIQKYLKKWSPDELSDEYMHLDKEVE